jgi:hypothetical protein
VSSASIGKLWPDIDKLDGVVPAGASVQGYWEDLPPSRQSNMGICDDAACATGQASLGDAPGPSSAMAGGYGGGCARNKAARILSDAPGAVFASHVKVIHG